MPFMRRTARYVSASRAAGHAMGLLALTGIATGTASAASKLPRPVHVPTGSMPPLPRAEIDDTLAIGGETIGARKVRSRMTVAVQVNNTGPYRFVVDSGADTTVIGTRIARSLTLPEGTPVILNGMTASSRVPRVLVDELGLGDTRVASLELPVLREEDLGGDGMLGIDALKLQRLMLDFDKRTISIEDAKRPLPRMDGEIVVTAQLRRGQLILTQARANGRPIDAVIDTGSEITIGNLALREQLIKRRSVQIEKVQVTGVTGVTVDLELARVREIRLGSVILRNVAIAFADVPPFRVFGLTDQPALLLGTDLMEHFRRISLDFKARKVRFQLRRCAASGIAVRTTTMTASVGRIAADETSAACKP